ncbi:heavy metal-binding domain-containing protein [Guggenheimella bovis]
MIQKNSFDPKEYEFKELITDCVVVSSSMKDDFSVLFKTLSEAKIPEYEELIQTAIKEVLEKVRKSIEEKGLDAIFNASLNVERMFSSTILIVFSGDGVVRR